MFFKIVIENRDSSAEESNATVRYLRGNSFTGILSLLRDKEDVGNVKWIKVITEREYQEGIESMEYPVHLLVGFAF